MKAIDKILDSIRMKIFRLVSSEDSNTEGLTDLIAAYETFSNEFDKQQAAKQRAEMYNSGAALRARLRAEKNRPLSLMKIMKDIRRK